MKRLLLILFLFPSFSIQAQEPDITSDFLDHLHEKAAESIEAQLQSDTADIDGESWDEYFHTSDMEGERATGFSRSAETPRGLRIGCVCMDGSRMDERGKGACSGYGGVRFWIYQISEDSVTLYPTDNHWAHPEPLSEMELNNLSSRNTDEKLGKAPGKKSYGWEEVIIAFMICVTIAYVAKLWFQKENDELFS
jgi:hypothetical protein